MGISKNTVTHIISSLKSKGIIEQDGPTHNFHWIIKS